MGIDETGASSGGAGEAGVPCPGCGFESPAGFNYCGACGRRLAPDPVPASGSEPPDDAEEGAERRQLTVMFCDLVGSTELSGQLEPEDLRQVVRAYQAACVEVIEPLAGHVAQYLGDGLLVYFGYPEAHEDDARRAVRAGLEIVFAVPAVDTGHVADTDLTLAVRVGIHTGAVVTGEVGAGRRRENLALGETPNIAARLQGLAAPNTVVVSDTTYDLVRSFVDAEELGQHELKGVSRPVGAYRMLGEVEDQSRFAAAVKAGLTPMVGRQQELELLAARFEEVRGGSRRVVLVGGQAGIGKSRVLQAFERQVAGQEVHWLTGQCSSSDRNTYLHPIADLLRRLVGFHHAETPAEKLARLEQTLADRGCSLPDTLPFLAALLALPLSDRHPPLERNPETRKKRTQLAVSALLRSLASDAPLIVVVEDLHWADPSTLDLLDHLFGDGASARVLMLLTHRPEFESAWTGRPGVTEIDLGRLSGGDVETMIERVAGGRRLPGEVVAQVIARTDGVPLFVEALTRTILESGLLALRDGRYELTAPLESLEIPGTLQGSLMARLDGLGHGKDVAQLASTLGRDFSFELLLDVWPLDRAVLERELARLVQAGVLELRSEEGQRQYVFAHALIQEVAYHSILKSRRRYYHRKIARVLEEKYREIAQARPGLVGRHYSLGQVWDKATRYLTLAGDGARDAFANDEALAFYREATDNVQVTLRTAGDDVREWQSLFARIQESAGDVLALARRRAEAIRAFRRALAQVPENDALWEACLLRKTGLVNQFHREQALLQFALAESTLGKPAQPGREWWQEWIHIQLGRLWTHYWKGDAEEMLAHLERVRQPIAAHGTTFQRAEFSNNQFLLDCRRYRYFISDEIVGHARDYVTAAEETGDLAEVASARFTLAFALLFQGRLDEAEAELEIALEKARKSGNKAIEVRVVTYLGTLHRRKGRLAETRRLADESLAMAIANNMEEYCGMAKANLAWIAWRDGNLEAAEARGRAALEHWQTSSVAYPFQWAALLPLLAVSLARGRRSEVLGIARALLDGQQQRLPDELNAALESLVADGDPEALRSKAGRAVAVARELGFL